jgi:hypothetical protein
MKYRMEEVRGWQNIQERLLDVMRADNMPEDVIWTKSSGEVVSLFFQTLTNLQGIKQSTDGGERNNLIGLAVFAVNQAKQAGIFDKLKTMCSSDQLDSLNFVESIK